MFRIRKLREERKMTQKDLAAVLHVEQQTISKYESGNIIPDIETCKKLAELFGVSLDYLAGMCDNPRSHLDYSLSDLSQEEQGFVFRLRSLSPSQRNKVDGYIDALSENLLDKQV